jgi:HEAT repeat protein
VYAEEQMMRMIPESELLQILDSNLKESREREKAIRDLAEMPNERVILRLVEALQDDDFGVRWEASVALSKLGNAALPSLLKALMDPKRVGDPRLRRGAYRVLKSMRISSHPGSIERLMEALHGPAADIVSMEEAYRVYCELKEETEN